MCDTTDNKTILYPQDDKAEKIPDMPLNGPLLHQQT